MGVLSFLAVASVAVVGMQAWAYKQDQLRAEARREAQEARAAKEKAAQKGAVCVKPIPDFSGKDSDKY